MDIRSLQEKFGAWLDQGAAYLDSIPLEILLLVLVLPLALALISARLLVIIGTVVFLIASIVVLMRPSLAAPAIASVMWVMGTFMAAAAIFSRRSHRALQAQLESLQEELGALQVRESQRYFAELRYGHPPTDANGPPTNNKSPAS